MLSPLIAIVDDDERIRASLENLIRSVGFRARAFPSAQSFLASPDLDTACLILDVRMPRMSGVELREQLVSSPARVPIIFVTSHVDENVRVRALDAGAVAFMYKPFRDDDLLEAVDSALRRPEMDTTKV